MATLEQLQKALDENRLDPSQLSNEQYDAVNQLIQEGKLKSKPLADIEDAREDAAVKIARVRQIEEDPIRAQRLAEGEGLIKSRATAELVGDVIGSVAPLILMRGNILKAAKAGQLLGKQTQAMTKMAAAAPDKMKFTKGIGQRLANLGQRTKEIATSPLAKLEAASIAGGTVGAGAGSLAYDLTNEQIGADITAAMTADLGEIPKKEIDQDIGLNAYEAMKNAALWNTGAAVTLPIFGKIGRMGFNKLFGVKGDRAKALAQFAKEKGLPIPLMAAFKDGPLSELGQNYFKTVGVFPFVSGIGREAFQFAEQTAGREYLNNFLTYAPVIKSSALGEAVLNQMTKTFDRNVGLYTAAYKKFDAAAEAAGNPAVISLTNSNRIGQEFVDGLEQYYPRIREAYDSADLKALKDLQVTGNDSLYSFAKFLKATRGSNISFTQYKGMMEMLNKAIEDSSLTTGRQMVYQMREAMETDLLQMGQNLNKNALKNDPNIKATIDAMAPETAERYLDGLLKSTKGVFNELASANETFSRVMNLYTKGGLVDKFRAVDRNLFTQKALFNFTGKANISKDAFYKKLEDSVFLQGDAGAIRQFKELVGAEDLIVNGKVISKATDDGKFAYDAAANRYFFNQFLNSFDTNSSPAARSIFNALEESREVMLGVKGADTFLKEAAANEASGITIQNVKKGLGQMDSAQIRFSPDDFAQFNINKFMNRLGIGEATNDLGREKLRSILKSQQHYDDLIKFTDYMKSISDVRIADSATFLQRRFMLGSLGAVAGGMVIGAGAGGGGLFAPIVFLALAKQFGKVLSDPVALRLANDAISPIERESIAATGKIRIAGKEFTAKSGIYKRLVPGVDLASFAKFGFAKKRDAAARFLNYLYPETKDNPQLDLNKVDPQEITDYLNNQPFEVPDVNYEEKVPPKTLEEMFIDDYIPNNIPEGELAEGLNLIDSETAAATNTLTEIADDTSVADETVNRDIQLASPGNQPTQTANADMAQALFPNDELLQLAARRRQNT